MLGLGLAVAATLSTSALVQALGICYDTYDFKKMDEHFVIMQKRFDAVRTYQTQNNFTIEMVTENIVPQNGPNVIDVAARHSVPIYAGVWIRSKLFEIDLDAAIEGARRHPNIVRGIFIGNEDLSNGWNVTAMRSLLLKAKQRIKSTPGLEHIPVGTVQTDGDWLQHPELAEVCDIIGANIYSFFDPWDQSTINNFIPHLDRRWSNMVRLFGSKVMLTETGWPSEGGGPFRNHRASLEGAIKHFWDVQDWIAAGNGGPHPMYFMFHDNPSKSWDPATLFEDYFGLAYPNGQYKFDVWKRPPSNPRLKMPFKIATSGNRVVRGDSGVLMKGESDDVNDRWRYDSATHQVICQRRNECLDGFWEGGRLKVHLYACDPHNNNQKWIFSGKRLKHEVYNMCLDADRSDKYLDAWHCDENDRQDFSIANEMKNVALVTQSKDRALSVAGDEPIEFKHGWFANIDMVPQDSKWIFMHDKGILRSESLQKCLDANATFNGATVHMWACDENNGNQKWTYDPDSKQLRHNTHVGFCLDMGSYIGNKPHLWECHAPGSFYAKYQQFDYLA
ncbi:unnamed protein product [Aphanomyces euteiches]|uniref:glucan endo-1,3-beta-D-glucosidase n=2 Tax=Aphanomyces euteiches TaxID=100861 RepID=A0A6G0XVU0_9STRA|nr:hypothetical protein Ae201684_001039 [Aphanomyces euteiches]KAH9099259.1 hypothetical protein Ae201684P_018276 [Aphanomyces euteiches]KAH9140179.1 hypothetical protein AeRB84_015562 [Aphanomyces euteiches]